MKYLNDHYYMYCAYVVCVCVCVIRKYFHVSIGEYLFARNVFVTKIAITEYIMYVVDIGAVEKS